MTEPASFEMPIAVQQADIDQLGHVNNVTYLRWVQEVATAHWQAAAPKEAQETLLWVVARHEIDYKRPAMPGDTVIARTWVGPASRLAFERNTELRRAADGVVLAVARTVWCPIDRITGRPSEVSAEVRRGFSTGAPAP